MSRNKSAITSRPGVMIKGPQRATLHWWSLIYITMVLCINLRWQCHPPSLLGVIALSRISQKS